MAKVNKFRTWVSEILFGLALSIKPPKRVGAQGWPLCKWLGCTKQLMQLTRRDVGYCASHVKESYDLGMWKLDDLPKQFRVRYRSDLWFIPDEDFNIDIPLIG